MIRKLTVWKKARELSQGISRLRRLMVRSDLIGVSPSIGRTVATVTACIAEAFEARFMEEKLKHLECAHRALMQCQYYLDLARQLEGWKTKKLLIEADQVAVILRTQIEVLKK